MTKTDVLRIIVDIVTMYGGDVVGNITDIKGFFRANVPDEVLERIVKKIQGGTRDAAKRISEDVKEGIYTKQVARDLFPHTRRGMIETRLFGLDSDFPEVTVTSQLNKTETNYHTLVRAGNVIMTASSVQIPYGIVREANFRNNYAGPQTRFDIDSLSNLSIVEFIEEPDNDDVLYGIILYCAASNNRFEISSVRVGFPNYNCTRYLDKIDVMRLFPTTTTKTEVEKIQDQAIVDLLLDEEEIFSPQPQEERGANERT